MRFFLLAYFSGLVLITFALLRWMASEFGDWRFCGKLALAGATIIGVLIFAHRMGWARDLEHKYADSELKSWFDGLKSAKGPCCSNADGTALSDVDWDAKDGHYRVRIEGQWIDVPDDAVIKEPNKVGRTMVWPIYYRSLGALMRIEIRCFMPGSMT
jgi:hypothetical protein